MEEPIKTEIAEPEKLPRDQTDPFAESLSSSRDQLDKLADEALEDARAGRTRPLRPDEL